MNIKKKLNLLIMASFLLLNISFVGSIEFNWYTPSGSNFNIYTCGDTRSKTNDGTDLTCTDTQSYCLEEGDYWVEFDLSEEGALIEDCRFDADPYTCSITANGYGKLRVKTWNINWDLNQTDCECYGRTWLTYVSGLGSGDCCGDDIGEYYCGAGYSACVNGIVSTDGDYDLYACECGELLVQGDCNDGETGCWVPAVSGCCGDDFEENFCDGVIGACSGGIYLTEPDDGAYVCECIIGAGRWNVGGEIDATVCCGDDSEYYKYKMRDTSNQFSIAWGDDITNDACCNADDDCVFNDVCYAGNDLASGFNPLGDDNIAKCYSGSKWADADGDFSLCQVSDGLYWIFPGEDILDPIRVGEYFSSLDGGDGSGRECCGDDYDEYTKTRVVGTDSTYTSDSSDIVCCNAGNKCVNDGVCYSPGDVIGEQYSENYCNASGIWEGGDASENSCDEITGVGNWYSGLSFELGMGDCCGDDLGETYRTMQCAAGVCIPPALPGGACCDTAQDCVYNSDCYTNVLDGDCFGSSNTCVDVGDGSNDLEVCTSAGWQDPDVNWEACSEVDGYPRETKWMTNGVCGARELDVGDCDDVDSGDLSFCCGDDLGEIVKDGIENICFYDPMQCYIDGKYYVEGEYVGDNYCEKGVITSRTKLVALQLLDIADQESPTDYTLFCDNYQNAVNYYGYDVGDPLVPVTQALSEVNNICVLKLPNQVIFGAALNQPILGGQFIEALEGVNNCFNAITYNDGKFYQCEIGGSKAWYNNRTQSIIYSKENIYNLPDEFGISFWEAFVTFLKNPFEVIFDFLLDLFRREGIGLPDQYEFINSAARFSRLYLSQKGGKVIRGVAEAILKGEYISVTYIGYSDNICTTVNMTDDVFRTKMYTERRFAICRYEDGNYYVATNASVGVALWPELTAGLRTS